MQGIDKVLRLALAPKDGTADRKDPARLDFSAAIETVRDAAEAIKAAEHRADEVEARARAAAQCAVEKLKAAEARIQALEARVKAAEARAQDAEEWLARVHEAITGQLGPNLS